MRGLMKRRRRRRWSGHRVTGIAPVLFVPLLFLAYTVLRAQAPASEVQLLFTGYLNNDCYEDAVYGRMCSNGQTWLPEKILWGQPVSPDSLCADSAAAPSLTETQFVYPDWDRFAGTVSFTRINSNDDRTDMLFILWGCTDSTVAEPDKWRSLVIFGQGALSTREEINIATIPAGLQAQPIVTVELDHGYGLSNPAVRDLSDVESYMLDPVNIAVGDSSVTPPQLLVTQVQDSASVRIYPNPSLYAATIEAALPAGVYTAKVVGVNGQVYEEQQLSLESAGTLWRSIDVSKLANGYYIVQLVRNTGVVGVYPFIIRR
jgi:hypothetical protein